MIRLRKKSENFAFNLRAYYKILRVTNILYYFKKVSKKCLKKYWAFSLNISTLQVDPLKFSDISHFFFLDPSLIISNVFYSTPLEITTDIFTGMAYGFFLSDFPKSFKSCFKFALNLKNQKISNLPENCQSSTKISKITDISQNILQTKTHQTEIRFVKYN